MKNVYKKTVWQRAYYAAKNRCENPNNDHYQFYGKKGIKFLMTKEDFHFIYLRDKAHLLKRPSIDRIDPKSHYEVSNCRYIEMHDNSMRSLNDLTKLTAEQVKTIREEYFSGRSKQKELAERFGVHFSTISKVIVGFSWKRPGRPNKKPVWPKCRKGHEMTKENTGVTWRGYRKCLTCESERIALGK